MAKKDTKKKKKQQRQTSIYIAPISEYKKTTTTKSNKKSTSSNKKSTSAKETAKKQVTTSKNSRVLDTAPIRQRESSAYKTVSESRKTTASNKSNTSANKTASKQTSTSKNSRLLDVAPIKQRETSTYTTPKSDYNKRDSATALSQSKNSRVQDIAPSKKKDDSRTWFQKPKAFEDGYQFGDVTKTILGSTTDVVENLASGIIGMGEKIVDASAYLAPGAYLSQSARFNTVPDMKLYNEMQTEMDKFIKSDLYDEQAVARKIISDPIKKTGFDPLSQSVFGEKSDSLVQSAGQLGATAGLQALGVPWFVTTGVTSFGGEVENAMKQGASYGEAGGSALISAGAEILSEKLSGGISFGGRTMDDVLVKNLTTRISDKTIRSLTKAGIDAVGEGSEEVVSSVFSRLGSALYKEEDIGELLTSEEAMDDYIESFIGGAVLGGGSSVVNATKSNAEGRDFATGLSNNELKVAQAEINNRIAEIESDGTKLSTKEKNAITQQVYKDLEKGYISIDTIESTLGGETYKKYKDSVDNETKLQQEYDELHKMQRGSMTGEQIDRETELKTQLDEIKKNSNTSQMREQLDNEMFSLTANDKLLQESYNEKSRRGQTFEADLSKYDVKQQEVIKRATESGILNNTNRTHEFVDMVAKISADKGVLFDFTNNEKLKESGFAMDGKTINGYVKDGNIAVNINSNKALNTIVGHEITHVLEGTELYTELQNAVKEYATTKGEYKARYDAFVKLYKDVDSAVIDNEVTADLVGDYLFTDADFVSRLSAEKPNVFKKIYDEIKYLVKTVTGSKESRELEKVKRAFDKAYKESAKATTDTKYSVSDKNIKNVMNDYSYGESHYTMSYTQDGKTVATLEYGEYEGEPNVKMIEVEPEYRRKGIGTKLLQELQRKYPDAEISFGMSTPDGTKLLESATYTVENKDVTDKLARIQEIQKVLDKYDEGYNNFFENDIEVPDNYAEDYNDLYDEKVALQQELRGKKKTKTFVKTDGTIDPKRISDKENDVSYSLSYNSEIAKGQSDYILKGKGHVSESELAEAHEVTNAMVDVMMKYSNILPEDKIGKVLTKNGSYDRSVENTTICVRTLAYNEFVDKVQEEIGRPLTQMESFLVSQKLYDIATEPQCMYCYVSLDRKAFNDMLLRYMTDRDTVIDKYNKSDKTDKAIAELYEEFLNGRKDTKPMKDRFNKWISDVDNGVQLLSLADIATEERQSVIKSKGGELAKQLADARKYAQSASWSKIQKNYVAYRDEILKLGDRVVKNLNEHYGLRWYSFSDYSPAFIVENMQQITDASIRGLKGLSYTKDTDYAEIFASSGMNINVSVFVNQDENGNFFIDEKQSANFERAKELREKYPNIGIVATVTNDEALRWAGSQEWSDVIIPFHIVRTGTDVAQYYKWLNYTSESADTINDKNLWDAYVDSLNLKSENARKKVSKNIYPNEHKNDKTTYLTLCENRGLTPRFARFAGEDWYMKLVNETRLSAEESVPLKPVYDLESAQASFQKFIKKGGYEGGWYKDGVDVDAEAKDVASDVLAGKQANEVAYGRQDNFDPERILGRRKTNRTHGKFSLSEDAPVRSDVNQYSLSDSDGKQLSKEQQNYFKDSKVRDENGNLKVMYHGTGEGGFHKFMSDFSDDGQSFFFVDNNTVAKSYSGTHETYTAQTFKTAEDFNKFFESINSDEYEVAEENGQFVLYEDGDEIATSDTADGIYEEFRDWTGLGYGSANYKVYLNLKNPLVVDAKNNNWDEVSSEFSQELYDKYQSLTAEEKEALTSIAEWEDMSIFRDEVNNAVSKAKLGRAEEYVKHIASAYEKLGGDDVNMYRLFDVALDNFSDESVRENSLKYLTTRDYSKRAKEQGYDGVIFNNIVDNGLYASGMERFTPSTVAIAFDSNQIKSVDNKNPTSDADIRYSLSEDDSFRGEYAPLTEAEANERDAMQNGLWTLNESDMPPEIAPDYGENPIEEVKPFDKRDIKDVGKRDVKAYMYENPEVKPYFQEEAQIMLRELRDSVKGERTFNDQLYYDTGGENGWFATKRQTSDEIAYLLDEFKYTYADIEKGLKAIIEDHGAENNAISKRIEFMIDERLREGYTDFTSGMDIPNNPDYIALLEHKQITEYNDEAYNRWVESLANVDFVEPNNIAPVKPSDQKQATPKQATPKQATKDIAPVKDTGKAEAPKVKGNTEQQQIASILAEEPKTESMRNKRKWAIFRANVFDKGTPFEDLSIKKKNRELMGKWNYTLYSEARAQRLMGNGNAERNIKSLNAIREEVDSTGLTKQFYEYMYHKHNVDRMNLEGRFDDIQNKPVFGYDVTSEMSQEIVDQYEFAEPRFKEFAQDVYDYMKHLRQQLVDTGVISQKTADLWQKMYPHYVPIRRVDDTGLNVNVPLDTGRTGVNAPIKKATGGSSDILPMFDTIAMRTMQTFKATAKNSFGVELKNTLGGNSIKAPTTVDELIDSIDAQDSLLQEGKNGSKPTFTVFENGERVTFEITEDMYDALKPVSDSSLLSKTIKPLNIASKFHRGLLTEYNPVFMLNNAIKDVQDMLMNSQHATKTYLKIPEAHKQMITKGYWYNEYMENGGEQNSYFDNETNTFDTGRKGVAKALDFFPLKAISKANNYIEMIPRLAEYIASREAGRSIEVSMLDSARVTTNFSAGGDLTKFINRNGGTFLNASVQGAMQQVRNVREANMNGLKGWANLATKFAVAGVPAFLLNNILWDDDEDYEELSDYVKQDYYVIGKYGDGQFIRIPKGRTVAVIQEGLRQIGNVATGNDEADLKSYLEFVVSNLAPNNPIENNVLAPIMQVINNETWYGEDLVPSRLQDVPKAEQFDESTDSFSRFLGEKLNFSPIKINYLLDQYTGGVGDVILPMLTPEAESGDDSLLGNLLAPLKKKFTTDSVMNNQNVSDFYALSDELKLNANKTYATEEDKLRYKYINAISSELIDLYAEKREIQNTGWMSDEFKYKEVRKIQQKIDELTKEALDTYDSVNISDRYATIGDKHFLLNEENEWRTLNEEQVEKQKQASELLGISAKEYWDNDDDKYAYDWAVKYPEYYQVSRAISSDLLTYWKHNDYMWNNIRADKDENGKSISGTKKAKIIDYINNIDDLEYEEKLVLFKKYYPADDTYNQEIIDYLNSRDDISYEQMETILKELDFEVDEDGNIYW